MTKEVINKISDLVTTAFGLVAALAWNQAIQGWFAEQEALRAGGPWVYAVIVTIIAVVATTWVGRLAQKVTAAEGQGRA